MKYKISQHLLILYGLTEPSDLMWLCLNIAILRSETQPHLIPCYIAMYGGGHTFVYEAEFCVIMDQFIFAGEHKSFTALGSGIGDGALDEGSGTAMSAVLRDGVDAEDHLPGTVFLVEGGILIHVVGQVSRIGDHAVYKGNELIFIEHEPEMVTVMGQAVFKIAAGGGLSGREAFRLNSGDSVKIVYGGSSD